MEPQERHMVNQDDVLEYARQLVEQAELLRQVTMELPTHISSVDGSTDGQLFIAAGWLYSTVKKAADDIRDMGEVLDIVKPIFAKYE